MSDPAPAVYELKHLQQISHDVFLSLREQYGVGKVVGNLWRLQVTNQGTSLVLPYQFREGDGPWQDGVHHTAL
jgi:hypothetical protein